MTSDILRSRFGFDAFKPGQQAVVDTLLSGSSALAVFPTGGGKSLCYQLPALLIEGVTLVVSPLIALMKDQIDFLTRRQIPAARLDSSMSADEVRDVNLRLRSGELKILYVAPERFQNERFLSELSRTEIGLFAIDEAHCISEWGHNFRPDYLKLADITRQLSVRRVLALTATATPPVVQDICRAFNIASEHVTLTGFYRPNLTLLTTSVRTSERYRILREKIRSRERGPTIVYVTLQRQAEQVAAYLAQDGLPARAYHAGMSSEDRTATQDWWMATPGSIVVATIAFGMGIDKADVRYVYHANLPKSLESYSQEIGRAGRDGLPAIVELLAARGDIPVLENFVYGDTPSESALRSFIEALLRLPEELSLNVYSASTDHDLRALVLRTVLTYLELEGALVRGTSFYAGYEFRPLGSRDSVAEAFPGVHGEFVNSLFGVAKRGRIWYGLDPEIAAEQLGVTRSRVVRALEVMQERNLIELRSSDVRERFTRTITSQDVDRLVAMLHERFLAREGQEIARLQRVVGLIENEGCQVAALVGYFGEELSGPCGHCSLCLSGQPTVLLDEPPAEAISERIPAGEWRSLRATHPAELGPSRSAAKYLCGLGSPAFTKSKLSRTSLFGKLEDYRFLDVLHWVETQA